MDAEHVQISTVQGPHRNDNIALFIRPFSERARAELRWRVGQVFFAVVDGKSPRMYGSARGSPISETVSIVFCSQTKHQSLHGPALHCSSRIQPYFVENDSTPTRIMKLAAK